MPEPTLAQHLARFAATVQAKGVDDEVLASVRQRVLDVLGLCVAAQSLPTSVAVLEHVAEQGGVAQAHAVGLAGRLPAAQAALANGVFAHSLDYDDTHLPSVLHPSAPVVPAALAAAQASQASGVDLARAVAVGLEVTVRLGMAGYDSELGNSVFFEHGQHATSICGAMGGAVAAGMLLGLDEPGLVHALGVTASMASGIIEGNRTGGTVKRLHCGWAAHSAVNAALLVRRGFTGPPTVLEGRFGFFQAFLRDQRDEEAITAGLGEQWTVPGIFFKPYPANHFTHAIVDAGMALRARGIDTDRISRIVVGVPSAVLRTVGEPIDAKRTPQTGYQAQFSAPYAVVAGLLGGHGLGVALQDYADDLVTAPERRRLMALVDVVADAQCDTIFPFQFPAVVHLTTDDGTEWTEQVLANRGGPQRPLTDDELAVKFADNVAGRLAPEAAADVQRRVRGLEHERDLDGVLEPLTRLIDPTTR